MILCMLDGPDLFVFEGKFYTVHLLWSSQLVQKFAPLTSHPQGNCNKCFHIHFTQTHFKTCHHSLTMYRRLWLRLSLSVFKGVHKLAGVGAIWTGTSRNRPTETGAAEHEISFFTVSNVLSQNSLCSNSHCSLHVLATCVSVYRFEVLAVHLFDVRTLGVEVELPWQIVWPGHPDWAYIKRFLGGWSVCHIWRLNSYCRYFHAPQFHHSLHSWWNNLMNDHIKLKIRPTVSSQRLWMQVLGQVHKT